MLGWVLSSELTLLALLIFFPTGSRFPFRRQADQNSPAPPFAQQAYLWQRDWTAPVRDAVCEHGQEMAGLVVLGAEIAWKRDSPTVIRVPMDYALLRSLDRPIGLCLRLGNLPGAMHGNAAGIIISDLVRVMLAQAKSNDLAIAELQVDFDCAESRLEDYRKLLLSLRKDVGRTPLTITVLPAWLKRSELQSLIRATDGYVLQVHSLERPHDVSTPFNLCDPGAARRSVAMASRLGVPFRVALPTYGYLVAFDVNGRFIGLSAEGPASAWPEKTQFRTVSTDPASMVGLVRDWTSRPPPGLTGIIWYRFPIVQDGRNWRWPTLKTVMRGEFPAPNLRLETRRSGPNLTELYVCNDGTGNYVGPVIAQLSWGDALLEARDALAGFESVAESDQSLCFRSGLVQLRPGEHRIVGWVRLTEEREVQSELAKE